MEEVIEQVSAQEKKLSQEERSKIMSDAAKRRWAKARKAKAEAAKPAKAAPKAAVVKKKPAAPREFSSALRTAEKRLAQAILERSKAAATYAVLSAEIPSLQRLIIALKNPLGALPEYGFSAPQMTLEQIVGDQALTYQNPPRSMRPAAMPAVPSIPVPDQLHPANLQSRAGGGAIDGQFEQEEQPEDEDQYLRESGVAGGQWH